MTTKRTRQVRLTKSSTALKVGCYIVGGYFGDDRRTWVRSTWMFPATLRVLSNRRKFPPSVGWEAELYEHGLQRTLFACARIALHDAIVREGWPSPWEVNK